MAEKIKKKKQVNDNCGVYIIINNVNQKVYIGSSVNVKGRIYRHFWELRKNIHGCCKVKTVDHLQNSYNKYGEENFSWKILKLCKKEKLIQLEQVYINKYNSTNCNCGYNIALRADGSIISKEIVEKIRKNNKKYEHLINEWAELYKQGLSTNKISKIYNINHGTIRRYLKENNVNLRNISESLKGIPKRLKYSHLVGEWQELYDIGFSFEKIAKKYNTNMSIIINYFKINNINVRSGYETKQMNIYLYKSKYEHLVSEWVELYEKGFSFKEIGKKYNINSGVISNIFRRNNIKARNRNEARKGKICLNNRKYEHLINEWIILYKKGWSFKDISVKYNIKNSNSSVVRKVLKRHLASQQNPCYNTSSETI